MARVWSRCRMSSSSTGSGLCSSRYARTLRASSWGVGHCCASTARTAGGTPAASVAEFKKSKAIPKYPLYLRKLYRPSRSGSFKANAGDQGRGAELAVEEDDALLVVLGDS